MRGEECRTETEGEGVREHVRFWYFLPFGSVDDWWKCEKGGFITVHQVLQSAEMYEVEAYEPYPAR